MSRPFKRGLSYFPLDTDLFDNRKIRRLLDKYGCEGTTVYLSVLCEIYAVEGYFISFNRNLCFDIAYILHSDEVRIKEILTFCVEIELFDGEFLEKHQALSSEDIQKRYLEVAKRLRRRGDTEVLTFETPEVIYKKTEVIAEITPVIDVNNPTKGKEKEKKIKKEKTKKENFEVTNFKLKQDHGTKPEQPSSANEDAERQAELRRMREAATADK
jgi:hypothetical protein